MEECSLPKARPILCNESPAFQRHHMSLFCAAESPNRFPWVINTTFGEKTYIRWCCNDRLSSQAKTETSHEAPLPHVEPSPTRVLSCLLWRTPSFLRRKWRLPPRSNTPG